MEESLSSDTSDRTCSPVSSTASTSHRSSGVRPQKQSRLSTSSAGGLIGMRKTDDNTVTGVKSSVSNNTIKARKKEPAIRE